MLPTDKKVLLGQPGWFQGEYVPSPAELELIARRKKRQEDKGQSASYGGTPALVLPPPRLGYSEPATTASQWQQKEKEQVRLLPIGNHSNNSYPQQHVVHNKGPVALPHINNGKSNWAQKEENKSGSIWLTKVQNLLGMGEKKKEPSKKEVQKEFLNMLNKNLRVHAFGSISHHSYRIGSRITCDLYNYTN